MSTVAPIAPPLATPRTNPFARLWSADEFQRMLRLGVFADTRVELRDGTVVSRSGAGSEPVAFRFTRKEYYALDDAGFFRDQRVQLIGGVIRQELPMNPPHAVCILLATKVIERVFGDGFHVRVQLPLALSLDTEPHPDLAVVPGSPRDYLVDHPTGALLVVEVSESTLEDDTHKKMSLYAAGGIADYWVIDVTGRLLVFRDPRPEKGQAFGHAYGRVTVYNRDDVVTPLAAPTASILTGDLLP